MRQIWRRIFQVTWNIWIYILLSEILLLHSLARTDLAGVSLKFSAGRQLVFTGR